MEDYQRYAVFAAPPAGELADFAAAWLGWDPVARAAVRHPQIVGLPRPVADLTATPRKYGFHGTLKAPFRLAASVDFASLRDATEMLAARLTPVALGGLGLSRIGGFVALVPVGPPDGIAALAAAVVRDLDAMRSALTPGDLARRLASPLSDAQQANLERWGYPYVMDEFRYHMTLSGDLPERDADAVIAALAPVVAPLLPVPFVIGDLCLFGEAADGRFHLLHRYTLSG